MFDVLKGCHFLTLPQLSQLVFYSNTEATKKRIQKLRTAGYVHCQRLLPSAPSCVWLTRKAGRLVDALNLRKGGFRAPPLACLEHEISVRDFRLRVLLEAARIGVVVTLASIDPNVIAFDLELTRHKPDAFFSLNGEPPLHFFVEVDRGTESVPVFIRKIKQYERVYKAGAFALRCGSPREEYKQHPFRVLCLFSSPARQETVLKALRQRGYRSFVLAAQFQDACGTPFGPIWTNPDGEPVTIGTEGVATNPPALS